MHVHFDTDTRFKFTLTPWDSGWQEPVGALPKESFGGLWGAPSLWLLILSLLEVVDGTGALSSGRESALASYSHLLFPAKYQSHDDAPEWVPPLLPTTTIPTDH